MNSPKMLNHCILCGSRLPEPIIKLENMPIGAQAMPSYEELDGDKGITLPLCRCESCGLVQFDCEPVGYYRDAIRVVGLSETMKELRRADYRHLRETYGLAGKKWIEIGCGNGDFLKVLAETEKDIYGTEAGTANVTEARAKLSQNGIDESHIIKFFPEKDDTVLMNAPFDCFLSFNFLEHQPDPCTMLRFIYNNIKADGIGLITVPSFEYILEKESYYELIRDHIANYDLDSLTNLVTLCGFEVLEKERIGIGDTLRMVVRKKAEKPGQKTSFDAVPFSGASDTDRSREVYRALADSFLYMQRDISGYMEDLERKGRSIALWGAGHQGFTVAATTSLKDNVKYIIDSSDKKYGRYAPASHIEIVPPETYFEHPVDVIMIAAPGYIKEIEKTIREKYGIKGKGPGVPAICDITDLRER